MHASSDLHYQHLQVSKRLLQRVRTSYLTVYIVILILGVEETSIQYVTFVLFLAAEAKDLTVEGNFPLKQEGGEAPQAQGDGAGK